MFKKRTAAALVVAISLAGCGSKLGGPQLRAADRLGGGGGGAAALAASSGSGGGAAISGSGSGSAVGSTEAGTSGTPAAAGGGTAAATPAPAGGNGGATDVGVTGDSINLGLVTTLTGPVPGLFRGAVIGTRACMAKVNAAGGIYGRQLKLEVADDQFNENQVRAQTERLIPKVFAFVGAFSAFDGVMGPPTEKAGVPDIGFSVQPARYASKVNFSPAPLPPGANAGGFGYLKRKYPAATQSAGFLGLNEAPGSSDGIRAALKQLGYKLVYDDNVSATTTDFTAQVFRMKTAGVRMLVMLGGPTTYPQLLRAADQQGLKLDVFNPIGNAYDPGFLKSAGPLAEGTIISHTYSMFAGEDAGAIPAVAEFSSWVKKIDADAPIDVFELYGWLSCHMFVKAAHDAGPKLTRSGVLAEMAKVTRYDGNGMVAPSNPAGKEPPTCYLVMIVKNGKFQRLDTPPPGFRCDGSYVRI